MSHNLVQKRGRYPKTKQENNLAQGGWQAQTLSVPSQSQGFSEVDYNYQNQNQKAETQHNQLYANQWTDHQRTMSEEPQQKLDPNGHSAQQDVWNDWGDQGWETWDNNNTQQQQQAQSYYGQPQQHQQAVNQQTGQYIAYDSGYHNQQEHQQSLTVNHQAYVNHPQQQVEQNNLSYPASCSTPHYQYSGENSVPPFNPSAHDEQAASGNQTAIPESYSQQPTDNVGVQPSEQIDMRETFHLQNQHLQQQYNHGSPSQQQHNYHNQQQLQQSTPPSQGYNNLNYDHQQSPQQQQNLRYQQFLDQSRAYSNIGQDGGIPGINQFNCMTDSAAVGDPNEQTAFQGGLDSQNVNFQSSPGAGGDDGLRERNADGLIEGGDGEPYVNEALHESSLISHEHKDEPISDSWDTLEDNMDCLSIQDPPLEPGVGSVETRGTEVEVPHQTQPQEVQQSVDYQEELSLQSSQQDREPQTQQQLQDVQLRQNHSELMQQQYTENEQQTQSFRQEPQQQAPLEGGEQQLEQPVKQPEPQEKPQQDPKDEIQLQVVSALPSLSEVLQAKNLKSEAPVLDDTQLLEQAPANVLEQPLPEPESESRASSSGSSYNERRDSFENAFDVGSQERTTYMANIIRPASEGAPAEEGTPAPAPHLLPISNYEPIADREVVGQRASVERSAPAGLDLQAPPIRQSPLGGEGSSVVPPATIPRAVEPPNHTVNSESYRSGSQDERARSRRSTRSSSSEDSEVAEHNREILHKKMREREHELPAVSKRDQKWRHSRDRLREHDYHSDESEVRKQRRRSNRDSDSERARQKYASDRDFEDDEYYDDRRYRKRNDRKRDSDETEYSEYASDRRNRYRSEDETDAMGRPRRRSDEAHRPRHKKYPEDSDFDSRKSGRRGNDRKRRDKRHDFYHPRPPGRDSSLNESIATSQISDSEVSMYDSRRTRPATFDRYPAVGMHQAYDSRSFPSSTLGFPVMSSSLQPRQPQMVLPPTQQSQISARMISHRDLNLFKHAYENDPDYRYELDQYFADCAAQGFDVSETRSYICNGSNLQQSFAEGSADLNESLTLSMTYAETSTRNEEPGPPEVVRKFINPHAFARFTSLNSFVKLHPSQRSLELKPPVVEIHDLKLLLEDDPESKALAKFPGPLVRADTHKNQVIHFCNQRVNAIRKNKPYVGHIVDRESYVLLWELLILLLRQNGHVTGTDIAELLLKDAPYVDPASVQKLAEEEMSQIEESDHASSDDSQTTVDGTRLNRAALQVRRQGLSADQALSRFRELLLFGHRREAIEHAIRYELWGHAFCLSSKMDMKLYTYVHSKFYQSFAGNDPLQTVYQLYSGRQPTSVTCVGDVTWGDWRPHLAMILANPSVRPEIDARSIITMGEILLSKGCLFAAHFCYLMAQVDFGEFQDKRCKLVLLGSNHLQSFEDFATNEAIVCTEIYEYAQSLSNPGYSLPTLGVYKYLHAKRLVDRGFVQEGLHYCERLAIDIARNVDAYKPELIHEVYCLASKMRYHDAHYSQDVGNHDDLGHPQWLINLEQVDIALQSGLPIDRTLESRRSSDFDGSNIKLEPQYPDPTLLQQQGQQQQQLQQQQVLPAQQLPPQVPQQVSSQQQFDQPQQQFSQPQQQFDQPQQQVYDYYTPQQQEQPQRQQPQSSYYSHPSELPPHAELKGEEESMQAAVTPDYSNEPYSRSSSVDEIHQAPVAHPAVPEQPSPYNAAHHYGQRQSVASVSSSITSASTNDSMLRPHLTQNEATSFQPKPANQTPTKTEPTSALATPSQGKKAAPTTRAGSSWLNGIFKSFIPKMPNQIKIPDDKEQQIVWDEEKKMWVDRDADPATQAAFLAPPPRIPLMTAPQSAPQDVPPATSVDRALPAPTPPSGVNMYRNTRKFHHADANRINNPTSPAAQDGNIPPPMIPSAQPQFMTPLLSTGESDPPYDMITKRIVWDSQHHSQESGGVG